MIAKINAILLSILGILVVISGLLIVKNQLPGPVLGSTPHGIPVATSTTSLINVGSTSVVTLFNANVDCASRVISTASSTIMISFGSTTPDAITGSWQAASTTAIYDSGLYGCRQWRAFGFERSSSLPSSTITVIEFYQ